MSESSLRLLLIFFSFMSSHKILKCFLRAFILAMSSSVLASESKSTFNVQCMIHVLVYAVFWFITPPKITSNLTCTYIIQIHALPILLRVKQHTAYILIGSLCHSNVEDFSRRGRFQQGHQQLPEEVQLQ